MAADATEDAFAEYISAVGRLSHAWNRFQEELAQLFVQIVKSSESEILAIWYSSGNDRAQRNMLRAAIKAKLPDYWPDTNSVSDLEWLLKEADALAEKRNDAVHAPASLSISDEKKIQMAAAYWHGHPRAKRLEGKRLLDEFAWATEAVSGLRFFANCARNALERQDSRPWPDRPLLPPRGQKNSPQDQPRQQRAKPRALRRRASRLQ